MADRRTASGDATGNSMTLLQNIIDRPLDDDYYTHAPHPRSRRGRVAAVAVVAFFALLITLAILQTRASAPAAQTERAVLLDQIAQRRADIARLQGDVAALDSAVSRLQREAAGSEAVAHAEAQGAVAGTIAVTGPGLRVTVDGGPDADDDPRQRVRDKDLQKLVNGLWQAGAEAIAVNGNRLTAMSSIRAAGEGITVNYRSLTSPFVVTAIGSPRTLPGNFVETAGAEWWSGLKENLDMRFELTEVAKATVPAAPRRASTIRHATVLEVSDK